MTNVLVKSKNSGSYQQEIKTPSHTFVADVNAASGGTEAGPDPHELLLGALGACTSITLQMFAKRRGWELKDVSVNLSEEKIDDPENPGRQISKITRQIEVKGDFNQEQLEALGVAADKCQIHKLLTGSKKIESNVKKLG